jgi:hypothetical protein
VIRQLSQHTKSFENENKTILPISKLKFYSKIHSREKISMKVFYLFPLLLRNPFIDQATIIKIK